MATYSESEKARMLRYPIVSVLEILGKRTDHRGCLYFSPFREEASPSMHINLEKNIWNDFGEGSGGNVFTLVTRVMGFRGGEAWDFLSGLDPTIIVEDRRFSSSVHPSSKIVIDSIGTAVTKGYLVRYAASRGIPEDILQRYCSQISYHIEGYPSTTYTALGFPAGESGWTLRHANESAHCKRCTCSGFTAISGNGEFSRTPESSSVLVFEGFFDYLSWQAMQERLTPKCDVCVLNSVTNVDRAIQYIVSHELVGCWLDNDAAGHEAFGKIMEQAGKCTVIDHSPELGECKDVNQYLMTHPIIRENDRACNIVNNHSLTL